MTRPNGASSRSAIIDRSVPLAPAKVSMVYTGGREAAQHRPATNLLYVAHEQDERSTICQVCLAFDVSRPLEPATSPRIPAWRLEPPSANCATRKASTWFHAS
jgi:hypothetical protein